MEVLVEVLCGTQHLLQLLWMRCEPNREAEQRECCHPDQVMTVAKSGFDASRQYWQGTRVRPPTGVLVTNAQRSVDSSTFDAT